MQLKFCIVLIVITLVYRKLSYNTPLILYTRPYVSILLYLGILHKHTMM